MKKVATYGTFDLFHDGHKNLLKQAKAKGDYLIVGVTSEQYDIQRGKMNVVDPLLKRIDHVRDSGLADEIIIELHEGQKIEDIQKYGIDVLVLGSDWAGKFDYLNEYCKVEYVERTKNVSSTDLRNKRNGTVRLGIVGTGRIAIRTMEEIKFVSGVETVAAFNPRMKSAYEFAENQGIDSFYDKYGAFLQTVDAVYVASPHETHYEYAKDALLANKHVLCEKPMVLCVSEARELYEVAEKNHLVLMEAIKTAYAPGFVNLIAIAKSGRIGKIRDVEGAFTKLVPDTPQAREYDSKVGGSFTELASYPLLPIIKLLGTNYRDVRFECFKNDAGVDIYSKAYFKYDGAVACAKTGIGVKSEGQLLISGTKGYILVKSPWWLIKTFEVCYENPHNNESFSAPFPGYGMRYEVADFVNNINEPDTRNYKLLREESIAMAGIMGSFMDYAK